jgi:hypothetical protein
MIDTNLIDKIFEWAKKDFKLLILLAFAGTTVYLYKGTEKEKQDCLDENKRIYRKFEDIAFKKDKNESLDSTNSKIE